MKLKINACLTFFHFLFSRQSLHRMRNTDFDTILRLKCLANGWQIPIIIFGTYYEAEGLQYAVVMLRNANGMSRAIFCIMEPNELVDIHSRLCEVVCLLIETIGAFPDYNYVFAVQKDSAHLCKFWRERRENF